MTKAKSNSLDDIGNNPFTAIVDKIADLPKLPAIKDEALLKAATTHPSIPLGDDIAAKYSYERLSFSGEGVLFTFITSLIQDTVREAFRDIDAESAATLRSRLTSPPVLSAISIHYDLPKKLIISRHLTEMTCRSIKSTADMFTAYLGGLFYSLEREFFTQYRNEGGTANNKKKEDGAREGKKRTKLNDGSSRPALQPKDFNRTITNTNMTPERNMLDLANEIDQARDQASAQAYIQLIPFLRALFCKC
ncbi:uncharacterized protein I303_106803 [Kwoniella dejecticola CBS 10117]|uniref:RNase III domain-containing protein n=1 Tax=Kwoniella dejecticola CBS 10117 TaxID=1296121 RepID=A0A1A5ZTR5_9TREE|nr:uncharacterized protein I303_08555 [Kwoniella dejecticola CBS 10117]OBR81170.1 hypothetical protein I303_08555 [Kwoniella dejecticola CBS 10117]